MPCIGCIWCVLSFAICFIIAKVLHHLPTWFIFPPISFLGYQMPEHVVYAVCFTAGAVCFFISFLYIQKYSFKIHGLYLSTCSFMLDAKLRMHQSGWLLQQSLLQSVRCFSPSRQLSLFSVIYLKSKLFFCTIIRKEQKKISGVSFISFPPWFSFSSQ